MSARGDANRSVRTTKRKIKESIVGALKEKPFYQISVSELAARADISRSTFYLYYKDIYDLLEHLQLELLQNLDQRFEHYQESKGDTEAAVVSEELWTYMQQERDLLLQLLGKNGEASFHEKIVERLEQRAAILWQKRYKNEKNFSPVCSFLSHGLVGLLIENLKSDTPTDVKQISIVAGKFLSSTDFLFMEKSEEISKQEAEVKQIKK